MLVLAIGGHWALMQSVAWVRMAVSYSMSTPLREALRMTFDGRHPCQLCKAVQAGKNSERKKPSSPPDTKMALLCRLSGVRLLPQPPILPPLSHDEFAPPRTEPPPTPPPRSA